jgi:hypothetical protein
VQHRKAPGELIWLDPFVVDAEIIQRDRRSIGPISLGGGQSQATGDGDMATAEIFPEHVP